MLKKTLVLSGAGKNYQRTAYCDIKGVVTLSKVGFGYSGELKLYNVADLPAMPVLLLRVGDVKLEFEQVANLEHFKFDTSQMLNLADPIYAAVGIVRDFKLNLIAYGKSAAEPARPEDMFDDYISPSNQKEIEAEIDKGMEEPAFTPLDAAATPSAPASAAVASTPSEKGNFGEAESEPAQNFYMSVEPQLNELFRQFPRNQQLEQVIDGSEWATVNYGGAGNHYVVGKLKEGVVITHICYGVPAKTRAGPPKQLEGFCQWMPLDAKNPEADGYWMMYQSAITGDNVEFEIV
ncbi:MAG: hypothetical protein FWE53_05370 [Firmicutes bacterium]|nr:hypothetical protein [Bacillota bacterium]